MLGKPCVTGKVGRQYLWKAKALKWFVNFINVCKTYKFRLLDQATPQIIINSTVLQFIGGKGKHTYVFSVFIIYIL